MSNNWLSALIAICLFCYNLFSKIKKKNSFSVIIDEIKSNVSSRNKVGLEYKFKFIIYLLISIYAMCYAILAHFDADISFESLKIFT